MGEGEMYLDGREKPVFKSSASGTCDSCAVRNEQAGVIDDLRTHCQELQHDKRDLQEDKKDLRESNRELQNELSLLRAQVRNSRVYQNSAKVSAVVEGA